MLKLLNVGEKIDLIYDYDYSAAPPKAIVISGTISSVKMGGYIVTFDEPLKGGQKSGFYSHNSVVKRGDKHNV